MNKHLNIVSFDVPYPPNYGGVIDVFFKLKALSELGIKIHLHTFEYGRGKHKELNEICESVTYYKRNMSPFSLFSSTPFIVKSRANKKLITNLNANRFPVLLEGLHTSSNLEKIKAKTYIRTHNIEHKFYNGLAKSEQNIFKKLFFFSEKIKLKSYESILYKTKNNFTISPAEQTYFSAKYGEKSIYVPAFHRADFKEHKAQKGEFVLWHGDLRVSDNIKASKEIIDTFKNSTIKLIIASSFEEKSVINKINEAKNIDFVKVNNQEILDDLLEKAHINVLLTYQKTGIKLKLLYSLYQGKFIIANNKMIDDTGLESLCVRANSSEEILKQAENLFNRDFTTSIIEKRKQILAEFNPTKSAQKVIDTIFN